MHNAELWTHRAPICLLMRWCKDFSPCIKDWTKKHKFKAKSKVLFKLCVTFAHFIKAQYMADIWGECERGEKGMMRDPDEPLPQKQGLISTSHPIKVSLYHFITQPRNLKSDSVRNFVKMKRSVWQEHCNRIYSIRNIDCTSIVVWRESSFCGDNKDDQKLFWKVTHKYILLGSNLNQNDSR